MLQRYKNYLTFARKEAENFFISFQSRGQRGQLISIYMCARNIIHIRIRVKFNKIAVQLSTCPRNRLVLCLITDNFFYYVNAQSDQDCTDKTDCQSC